MITRVLKDIANISSGTYKKEILDGDFLYLQIKDFTSSHLDKGELNPSIPRNKSTEKHLLSDKDLLFSAKGTSNFCVIYYETMGKAIASSSFFIIHITKNIILPEFLNWYINLPRTIKKLQADAVGSFTPSISKEVLSNLNIDIPSITIQQKIITLKKLQIEELKLQTQLLEKKKKLYNQILMNIIKSDK